MSDLPIEAIDRAVAALHSGELVIVPTETVYGLAADARSPMAIQKLVDAKGRLEGHPLPVQISLGFPLERLCEVGAVARALIDAHWPGPLTLVLPCRAEFPQAVTAGLGSLGVRCPDHRVMSALLKRFGGPLAVPSANRAGQRPAHTVAEARSALGPELFALDGGRCDGTPSTVVSLIGEPRVLRRGPVLPSLPSG